MNKIKGNIKILLGFLIISCTVFAQNQPENDSSAKAVFTIDNKDFDYGNIPEDGGLANHTFTVKNTGNNPLAIKQVVTSCGCTTPNWTKVPIAPGNTGEIMVAYDPKGRPGPFSKTISVYCDNADPVQLTIKGNVNKSTDETVRVPVLSLEETSHDFGTIGENDGSAEHLFKFVNTGNAPLTISRVTASCGCTKPEWSQAPVEPGQEGYIIISYNPVGRLGNFNKNAIVYTNEEGGYKRHKLTIVGDVIDKPGENKYVTYIDTIGGVGLEKIVLAYREHKSTERNTEAMYIRNNNPETVYFSWDNVPDYVTINCPDSLKADWQGEVYVYIDGVKTSKKRGRITDKLALTIKDRDGKILGSDYISATVNYLDDFKNMSPLQMVSAPSLEINNTLIEFGDLKSGFLKGSANKQIILTNTGKSDLILHSVSGEDSRIHLPDLSGKTVKAGESLTVNAIVKAKELDLKNIDAEVYIVCNDPKNPVRRIKVTAQKAK